MGSSSPDKHCRMSPSGMKRILECPFSAQNNLPQLVSVEDKTGGKAATAGTDKHDMACGVLSGRVPYSAVPYDWMESISLYVDHARQNEGDFICEHFWESIAIDEYGGTTDCTIINKNKCVIYDYKSGKWDVQAEDNKQLLSYASIVAEHHNVDQFWGVIVQPNVFKGKKIKVAEYTLDEVDEHRAAVAAAAVSDEKGVGDHCRFCPLHLNRSCDEGNVYCKARGWK